MSKDGELFVFVLHQLEATIQLEIEVLRRLTPKYEITLEFWTSIRDRFQMLGQSSNDVLVAPEVLPE